jgi:hypothetical protein
MSVVPHGILHDPLNSVTSSLPYDVDPNRISVVNCLVPGSIAVVAR